MSNIRVVVSTGSDGMRKKIVHVLASAGMMVVGETASDSSALRLIQQLQPDVAIVDIDTAPGLSAAKMLEEDGQIGLVLLGTHPRRGNNGPLLSGQLLKPVNEAALLAAVEFAAAGQARLRKMADELAKFKEQLESRKLIEKAKGILMETLGIPEAEAYRRIQQQSMNKRVALRRIAEAIITAHEFR